ncbi:MAG TPA: dihydroxyacetone kinase subunit DhaK [Firmicutes bacterium]|jgi:dihydroxyacetone kinase|nr:dihydroxyacetone kinase subunit DhaK [Bacillota bacterium]
MKKIMNRPDRFANETLEGILRAHPRDLKAVGDDLREIVRANAPQQGKVAIATGGGSGHLPVFLGYVGEGLADGVAVGDVFNSPSAQQMYNVTRAIDGGKGVLYLYGNYGGDVMNFDMAAELASMDDIRVESIRVADDVASSPKGEEDKRRGVAGLFFAYKIAGAKAETGAELDEVVVVTNRALANLRSMGVALSPCIIPQVGKPGFTIGDDEMEIGMGIHGEPGIDRTKLQTADQIAETLTRTILEDGPYESGDEVAVLVNGLGATPQEELYIVYRKVDEILKEKGINVYHTYVGEFATSMEMAGMSLSILKLDDELKALLSAPAYSPFFSQPQL